MSGEWTACVDKDIRREVFVVARTDFEDEDGIRFECNFQILYHGGKGYNQPPDFKGIERRDLTCRRIPRGVTPPE